ncbi:gamma-glutamyl-gamma-aminobutyrate hydrolase family protein [Anaerofustis stercorihominis]|uniref:Peptidase C26 n=2 Tax=Anaerofustis stercorihominis TaxID=214853 RepID=B1C9V7_9FIRM|nr:gamma-glutamyl-gamma-aminobutyrate hydrolase family protein [Anaerofustis stercorihominis]EDS72173.1 peptidase C26 [Anaerofustis stercorihominis DSM 17244]MCQ4795770.1 gamma-glutamyl-gamma-aminobutyrate hydrolase family protein [Anaerofustis stercorihominis]
MKKPIIGIVPLYDEYKDSYWMLPGYMTCLEESGAVPIMLPLTINDKTIDELVDMCDGFLFSGGHDVNPELYNEKKKPECQNICIKRDEMEKILFNKVITMNKPILGICRGLQLINVLLGGSLYQDLESELKINHKQKPPYDESFHKVDIIQDTPLYNILNKDKIDVNSCHHQAVKELSSKLKVMAVSEDKVIEGAYMEDKKFVLAVQWHPECNYKKEDTSVKIIKEFINNCK